MGIGDWVSAKPDWHSDYLITHELAWHRKSPAKYKILYFSRPKVLVGAKTTEEIYKSYQERKIKLYINHFDTARQHDGGNFSGEKAAAALFRELWEKKTGQRIPFYGFENKDGYLTMRETQSEIRDSMFTLVFKGHETWGQMVNESMLIGTPVIMKKEYIVDMFTEYLITPDTALIGDTVEELIEKIESMTFEQYETLTEASMAQSELFTENGNRRDRLMWLFDKVEMEVK
jgi:hypothetical protein